MTTRWMCDRGKQLSVNIIFAFDLRPLPLLAKKPLHIVWQPEHCTWCVLGCVQSWGTLWYSGILVKHSVSLQEIEAVELRSYAQEYTSHPLPIKTRVVLHDPDTCTGQYRPSPAKLQPSSNQNQRCTAWPRHMHRSVSTISPA